MFIQSMASLADAISALSSPFPRINMIKRYKGAMLSQQSRIIEISPESATIQASQRLTYPVLHGPVYLRSRAFTGAICANIHAVDYSQGTFQLSELAYSEWQDRRGERVQPKNPTYVDIETGGETFRACLEDISADGLCVLVNRQIDPEGVLQAGARLMLRFRLIPGQTLGDLPGSIIYRRKAELGLVKLGLNIFPDEDQKAILREYVIRRYDEIMEELKQDFNRMREPCRVENLYF